MTANSLDALAAKAKAYPPVSKSTRREAKVAEAVKAVTDLKVNAADVLSHKIVQAEINFATAGNRTVADHGTGITIPAGAVVIRCLTKVTADLDSTSHTGTAQLFLGASSGGLSLGAAVACDGSSVIQPWTVESSTNCPGRTAASSSELTVAIATNAITSTSGKIQYIVEYITPA